MIGAGEIKVRSRHFGNSIMQSELGTVIRGNRFEFMQGIVDDILEGRRNRFPPLVRKLPDDGRLGGLIDQRQEKGFLIQRIPLRPAGSTCNKAGYKTAA